MKPKETNTATITEAHVALVRNMAAQGQYLSRSIQHYAQEIADSEARACAEIRDDFAKLAITSAQLADNNVGLRQERDQLRAEVERADAFYRRACEVEHEMRAELASEVERLTNACNSFSNDEILQGSWIARAERAEAVLGKLQELHGCSREMVVYWCEHAAKRALQLDFQMARNSDLFTQRDEAVEAQGKAEAELSAEREKVRALRDALTEIMENSSGWAESTAREALESAEGAT